MNTACILSGEGRNRVFFLIIMHGVVFTVSQTSVNKGVRENSVNFLEHKKLRQVPIIGPIF